MSSLRQWREALEAEGQESNRFYHAEMMDVLKAGELAADLAALGAFIDGEGCVNITQSNVKRGHYYSMQVLIWNTDRAIIEWLADRWQGGVYHGQRKRTNATENPRACHAAWWSGSRAEKLLQQVEPYVRIKHEQVLNALAFQKVKTRARQAPGRSTPPHLQAELAAFYARGRVLNGRETAPATVQAGVKEQALQLEIAEIG